MIGLYWNRWGRATLLGAGEPSRLSRLPCVPRGGLGPRGGGVGRGEFSDDPLELLAADTSLKPELAFWCRDIRLPMLAAVAALQVGIGCQNETVVEPQSRAHEQEPNSNVEPYVGRRGSFEGCDSPRTAATRFWEHLQDDPHSSFAAVELMLGVDFTCAGREEFAAAWIEGSATQQPSLAIEREKLGQYVDGACRAAFGVAPCTVSLDTALDAGATFSALGAGHPCGTKMGAYIARCHGADESFRRGIRDRADRLDRNLVLGVGEAVARADGPLPEGSSEPPPEQTREGI